MDFETLWYQLKNTLILRKQAEKERRRKEPAGRHYMDKEEAFDFVREIMDYLECKETLCEEQEDNPVMDEEWRENLDELQI